MAAVLRTKQNKNSLMMVFVENICFRMAFELEEKTKKGSFYKSHKENNTTAVPFVKNV